MTVTGFGGGVHAQAVGLLGDLLERNYVPSDFQAYMGVLFQQTFTLLHLLTGLPPSADLPSAYVAKCNHFFWQFSSNYFGRIQVRTLTLCPPTAMYRYPLPASLCAPLPGFSRIWLIVNIIGGVFVVDGRRATPSRRWSFCRWSTDTRSRSALLPALCPALTSGPSSSTLSGNLAKLPTLPPTPSTTTPCFPPPSLANATSVALTVCLPACLSGSGRHWRSWRRRYCDRLPSAKI